MKTLFIPAKINSKLDELKILEISKKLPKNLVIAYSIQYKEVAEKIKNILSKKHKILSFIQVLGCTKPKLSKNIKSILLIGSGRFHAVSLALESGIPVYILESNKLDKISEQEINSLKKKHKASYLKFLNSDKIGILISTKPGQENLKKALATKKKIKNKKSYIFLNNQININEFENFPDIQSWVNTACPRLDFDARVVNAGEI